MSQAKWTYSNVVDKLFVKMATPCPIKLQTNAIPPNSSIIRATLMFSDPHQSQEVVQRYLDHINKDLESRESMTNLNHLIRCEYERACYLEDSTTCRMSVIVPHEMPQVGAAWVIQLYQFTCWSICPSIKRRPLNLVLTLECRDEVLGRQCVGVRCCASPGRDRKQAEGKKPATSTNAKSISNVSEPSKPGRTCKIVVAGRANYEALCRMRDALEAADELTKEQRDAILAKIKRKHKV